MKPRSAGHVICWRRPFEIARQYATSPRMITARKFRLGTLGALLTLLSPISHASPPLSPEPLVVRVHYPAGYKAELSSAVPSGFQMMKWMSLDDSSSTPSLPLPAIAVDLTGVISSRLSCTMRERGGCVPLEVLDEIGDDPPERKQPTRVLDIRFNGRSDGFFVVMNYDGADPDRGPEARHLVTMRHASAGCDGLAGDPMAYFAQSAPDVRSTRLHACWFGGSPTRFEGLVGAALDELVAELHKVAKTPADIDRPPEQRPN